MKDKIIQIIPAPAWLKVQMKASVVCLALVEDNEGRQRVRVMNVDESGHIGFVAATEGEEGRHGQKENK